ncbi:MAG: transcription termination/antitermination protein NusG [Bacillales bacterium]
MADNIEKQWYIVTTYSNNEEKVAENIRKHAESANMQDKIFRVIVATEKELLFNKDGSPKMVDNNGVMEQDFKIINLYPNYIFVEMKMTDDSWFLVRNTEGVTGIVGSSGGGQKPVPVRAREMERVLQHMGVIDEKMYEKYNIGDLVKIIHGSFANVEGKIMSIDTENGNVKIDTIFFGKHTPVDVHFSEIMKI